MAFMLFVLLLHTSSYDTALTEYTEDAMARSRHDPTRRCRRQQAATSAGCARESTRIIHISHAACAAAFKHPSIPQLRTTLGCRQQEHIIIEIAHHNFITLMFSA